MSRDAATKTEDAARVLGARVFVGNVPQDCSEQDLQRHFQVYGTIDLVQFVPGKFSFLTFKEKSSAQAALKDQRYNVRPAEDRFLKRKRPATTPQQILIEQLTEVDPDCPMLVLQCNKSHLERVKEYLRTDQKFSFLITKMRVKALQLPQSTNSLLFLTSFTVVQDYASEMAEILQQDPFLKNALNQIFYVSPRITQGPLSVVVDHIVDHTLKPFIQNDSGKELVQMRIQVFPPRLQRSICDALLKKVIPGVDFSPKKYSKVLSVVELATDQYVMGISDAEVTTTTGSGNVRVLEGSHSPVSRAYFKLREAMERYQGNDLVSFIKGKVAIDCGAAPGGWTKYLVEQGAQCVYSVDPGDLEPSIYQLPGVTHWRMSYQEAINEMESKGTTCGVLVSDMCLTQLVDQADLVRRALHILEPNALVVITLKCRSGYSQKAYEGQVDKVVASMHEWIANVQTLHLFSNRNSERTVIGFVRRGETMSMPTPSPFSVIQEDFERDGVVGPLDILSKEKVRQAFEQVQQELSTLSQDNEEDEGSRRFKLHLVLPALDEIAHHPKLVSAVQQALGTKDILLWSSDINIKPCDSEGFFAPHQDATFAGLFPPEKVLTAWIALSDPVGETEGCLSFYKGSHKLGQVKHESSSSKRNSSCTSTDEISSDDKKKNNNNMLSLGQYIPDKSVPCPEDRTTIPLQGGQATLHSFYTIHQSSPNRSSHDRVGFALRYMASSVLQTKPVKELVTVISGPPPIHFDIEPRLPSSPTWKDIQRFRISRSEALRREHLNYFEDLAAEKEEEGFPS
jgi:non-heme Fe2+,alpha-ketoglutarate-dependent halogenase